MNTAARLWKSLLDLARRPVTRETQGGESAGYALWLERPGRGRHRAPRQSCVAAGCGVCAAAAAEART